MAYSAEVSQKTRRGGLPINIIRTFPMLGNRNSPEGVKTNMYRAETIQDLEPLENLVEFCDAFPGLFEREVESEFERVIIPPLVDELRYEPEKHPDMPFIFSPDPRKNERARRRYHAMINSGEIQTDGEHYIRTHQTAQGWDADVLIGDGIVALVVEHKVKGRGTGRYIQFVEGDKQVPSHKATGWPYYPDTLKYWTEAAVELVGGIVKRLLGRI